MRISYIFIYILNILLFKVNNIICFLCKLLLINIKLLLLYTYSHKLLSKKQDRRRPVIRPYYAIFFTVSRSTNSTGSTIQLLIFSSVSSCFNRYLTASLPFSDGLCRTVVSAGLTIWA